MTFQRFWRAHDYNFHFTDPDSWMWNASAKEKWTAVSFEFGIADFIAKWYGSVVDVTGSFTAPHEVKTTKILVCQSYVMLFNQIWTSGMTSCIGGVVITGQPGIGKTLFQWYLLAQLLWHKQVILFCLNNSDLYLIFHGVLYHCQHQFGSSIIMPQIAAKDFDKCSMPDKGRPFIWSVFNICNSAGPDNIFTLTGMWPVQSTSPTPSRYSWSQYTNMEDTLNEFWKTSQPLTSHWLKHRAPVKDALVAYEENQGESFTGFLSWDELYDKLLETAVEKFGYSARDIFSGIFEYGNLFERHKAALATSYAKLASFKDISSDTKADRPTDSHHASTIQFVKMNCVHHEFEMVEKIFPLQENVYYMPRHGYFPLVDAFTIEVDEDKKCAILWLVQMTTSLWHNGSKQGYAEIQTIVREIQASSILVLQNSVHSVGQRPAKMRKVQDQVQATVKEVEICYLLVIPAGRDDHTWKMLKGWSKSAGDVYCMKLLINY
ncbi:hypothetical protein CPB84DRAFT_1744181 [Gymnopilus junonius]|uniref:Uncharacterized protein n=1 Tax=Gymnopilus junonius TaxID=109634 RepID=A0A9P5NTY2_GYMJU|nr:hypothetical protein CPB84DRAFT_1744181 [Gymnopilus junonius]